MMVGGLVGGGDAREDDDVRMERVGAGLEDVSIRSGEGAAVL